MSCFVIAEVGVNHNGSVELALELVERAVEIGADAVKFQTFKAEKLVNQSARTAEYQKKQTGETSQLKLLKELELTESSYKKIIEKCGSLNIEFMSTAFDDESLNYILALGVKRLKIPSGEITNLPFLEKHALKNIPMIISTGMSNLQEVGEAVETVRKTWPIYPDSDQPNLTLLHCTSNYPADIKDVNLRAMRTMHEEFGCPVGYSDHTRGIAVVIAAVALGASIIEKHITLDRNLSGPDHAASLEPEEFRTLVESVRIVEEGLGSPEKKPARKELPVRALARKSVTAAKDISAGTVLTENDLALLRPGTGIPPKHLKNLVGLRTARDLNVGDTIEWSDVVK